METKAVYKAINAIQEALSHEGITKDRKNTAQNYSFRGIDDVYNKLSPLLAEHHLCILPRMLSRTVTERDSKTGGTIFNVTLEAEFDLVSSDDGSVHTVRTFGEAMDSADKATNKAMSAAYKGMVFMAFAVPTEGDNDADASHHETKPREYQLKPPAPKPTPQPAQANKTPPPDISIRQSLWDSLRAHCNGKNADAGKILKKLTGKQFFMDLTEEEAKVAQVKFESDYLFTDGGRAVGEDG